jgi:hypothetical protein
VPHRGVALEDPRNRGILEVLQPEELTADSITARLIRAGRGKPPATLAETVARILSAPRRPPPPSQSLASVANALYGLGTHPDLIERLWALNAALPTDCRWVVHGYPALVHPESGVVFAAAMGTLGYALRLPNASPDDADRPGAEAAKMPEWKWSSLVLANPEWRFGRWRSEEPGWCADAFAAAA